MVLKNIIMKIRCCSACNFGGHKMQDAILSKLYDDNTIGLFVVCDGMSGLYMGREASKTVVDVFERVWDEHFESEGVEALLAKALSEAKTEIDKLSRYNVGTTMVMAATQGNDVLLAHLGDSRAYYYRPSRGLMYRSVDHITIGEEGWPYVSKGVFNFRELQKPTIKRYKIKSGDRLLLCSDGMYGCYKKDAFEKLFEYNMSSDNMMTEILAYVDEHATDDASGIIIDFYKWEELL